MSQQQPPPAPQQQQQPSPAQPIYIRQLPLYYPTWLHHYNIVLGKQVPQIAKVANFLDVPPLFLCIVVSSLFFALVFAKFLVNSVIIIALLVSSVYNCLYITAVLDQVVFSQILNLTISLAFLALYLLISPYVDLCLDWIPFYHPAKLFIAFSLTYHANPSLSSSSSSSSSTTRPDGTTVHYDGNPFPLVSLDTQHQDQQDQQQQQQFGQPQHTTSTTTTTLARVPELPSSVKAVIDLIQSIILLGRGYCVRAFRVQLWRVRTWAYNLKINYSAQENILDEVDVDIVLANINTNNNNSTTNDDIDLDNILEEYAIDEFNNVPNAHDVE